MNRSVSISFQLKYINYCLALVVSLVLFTPSYSQPAIAFDKDIRTGADRMDQYVSLLKDKQVGLCVNQTSVLSNQTHLVDTLMKSGVKIKTIFTPEHGFRGKADAGEKVANSTDQKTGLPIVSLYGKNKKPSALQLADIQVMIFDLQDVGARFYTYISTLHYLMEACAEKNIPVIVLDRPNPNGFYVDGPVLDTSLRSFVGMHPVPVVHGMTIGEYAQMINGEKWLKTKSVCPLQVITCEGYTHKSLYSITIPPSPNLTSMQAIYYYPTTCLFEGTSLSVGRGTDQPFRYIGMPGFKTGKNYFTPVSRPGAKDPVYKDKKCQGFYISDSLVENWLKNPRLDIAMLIFGYRNAADKAKFFTEKGSFNILAGDKNLKKQIVKGLDEAAIRKTWEPALTEFKKTRKKYLLYPDFDEQ